jgi:hypothetical protein
MAQQRNRRRPELSFSRAAEAVHGDARVCRDNFPSAILVFRRTAWIVSRTPWVDCASEGLTARPEASSKHVVTVHAIKSLKRRQCYVSARYKLSLLRFSGGLAERVGFEPTVRFPAHTLSKRAP